MRPVLAVPYVTVVDPEVLALLASLPAPTERDWLLRKVRP